MPSVSPRVAASHEYGGRVGGVAAAALPLAGAVNLANRELLRLSSPVRECCIAAPDGTRVAATTTRVALIAEGSYCADASGVWKAPTAAHSLAKPELVE
jgi:hypothetical protein